MAKILYLRWTRVSDLGNTPDGFYYESNLVKINSAADIQVQLDKEAGVDITYLLSLSGDRFVSIHQDFFSKLHIRPIPVIGMGQILKFRINKLPDYSIVLGTDVEDVGDVNPDDPDDILYGFAGSDGEYFRGNNSEFFVGKNP